MKNFKLTKPVLILVACAFVFGKDFITDFSRLAFEPAVPATVVARSTECRLVTRDHRGKRVRTKMACADAFAARKADPSRRTRVSRKTYVTLEFALQNGRLHTTRVRAHKVRALRRNIGDRILIAYKSGNPNQVFLPVSISKLLKGALWFGLSVVFLLLAVYGSEFFARVLRTLSGGARTQRAKNEQTEAMDTPVQTDLAVDDTPRHNTAPRVPHTQRNAVPKRVTPKFKQTKDQRPSVVSRRRGWFSFVN